MSFKPFYELATRTENLRKNPLDEPFACGLVDVSGRGFDPDLTSRPSMVYGVLRLGCSPLEPIRHVTAGTM